MSGEHKGQKIVAFGMLRLFKKDPIRRLQKQHASLMEQAHRMSSIDRTKADALVAQASTIEEQIVELQSKTS